MKVSSKINQFRRKTMKWLTGSIAQTKLSKPLKTGEILEIQHVLICRPNHRLGNLLLITPLIQEIKNYFPNVRIDLLVQGGVAPILFENYTCIDRIIQLPKKPFNNLGKYLKAAFSVRNKKYDLVVNAVVGSSSGKIYTLLASSRHKIYGAIENVQQDSDNEESHIAKQQLYNLRVYLEHLGLNISNKSIPNLSLKLSETEIAKGKKVLDSLVPSTKKTIGIYTFATGAKCFSKAWWAPFFERLVKEFSDDYNILEILPIENVSQIAFKAPTYYSKDIREMTALMANTEMYIGADCGIMHLASAAHIPVLGLFSKANMPMYEPYGHKSRGINTNEVGIDGYITAIKKMLD